MRFTGGWFKLHRKLWEGELDGDGKSQAIFVWLIGSANVQDGKRKLKGQRVLLKRGQLVTSDAEISRHTGFSRGSVRRRLNYLKSINCVTIETTNRGTVITVVNYDRYQSETASPDHQKYQPVDHPPIIHRSSSDHILKKERKKERKKVGASLKDSPTGTTITAYCDSYKRRYGVSPPITGKDSGLVKRVVKDLGVDKTISLLTEYLKTDGPNEWFKKKAHDLPTFVSNLNCIVLSSKEREDDKDDDIRLLFAAERAIEETA